MVLGKEQLGDLQWDRNWWNCKGMQQDQNCETHKGDWKDWKWKNLMASLRVRTRLEFENKLDGL